MSNRFTGRRGSRRGGRQTAYFEPLEGRQLLSSLPLLADTAATNAAYIEAVYQDVLDRPVDPVGLNWAAGLLNSGQSPSSLVAAVASSQEADADFTHSVYHQYLGRAADSAGIDYWLQQMQSGANNQAIEADLLSSDEFYSPSGGTTEGWMQAAYLAVLGRAAETEAMTWAASRLEAGASLRDLAMMIVTSPEAETRLVEQDLARFGMPIASNDVAGFSAQLPRAKSLNSRWRPISSARHNSVLVFRQSRWKPEPESLPARQRPSRRPGLSGVRAGHRPLGAIALLKELRCVIYRPVPDIVETTGRR